MTPSSHALISLEERFAEGILNGVKLVELRRRPMRLNVGTILWMYVKVPIGKVVGSAEVRSMHSLAPETLWRRYGDVSGLGRAEFFEYFGNIKRGFVLVLNKPKRLPSPVSLERLRTLNGAFQPPQFFQHLDGQGLLVSAFTESSGPNSKSQAKLPSTPPRVAVTT